MKSVFPTISLSITLLLASTDHAACFHPQLFPTTTRHHVAVSLHVHRGRESSSSSPSSPNRKTTLRSVRSLMSAIPAEFPRQRLVQRLLDRCSAPLPSRSSTTPTTTIMPSTVITQNDVTSVVESHHSNYDPTTTTTTTTAHKKGRSISRMDVALFATYFANMFVVSLSVVTVPAMAASHFATLSSNPVACAAALELKVASMAPLGGAMGKVVNGFVCQRIGGRTASWMYLVALGALTWGVSVTPTVGSIGTLLMMYEFLASIQWTALCLVLDEAHKDNAQSIGRGVAILSLSSYLGALTAKTVGAAMLNMSGCWRAVTRIGASVALVGAMAMYFGIVPSQRNESSIEDVPVATNKSADAAAAPKANHPASVLKSILSNQLFWMIGIGHSLGYVIRGSDRLLVPFLHHATGFSRHMCASMTAFVTLGLVLGLGKGATFSAMESIPEKIQMLRRNYLRAIGSFVGLGLCAALTTTAAAAPGLMAATICALSCLAACSISFQLSQFPVLVATHMFAKHKAVALSLVDAGGLFVTSQIFAANTKVLGMYGWSASWSFLALCLAGGASLMMTYMPPVLMTEKRHQRRRATIPF